MLIRTEPDVQVATNRVARSDILKISDGTDLFGPRQLIAVPTAARLIELIGGYRHRRTAEHAARTDDANVSLFGKNVVRLVFMIGEKQTKRVFSSRQIVHGTGLAFIKIHVRHVERQTFRNVYRQFFINQYVTMPRAFARITSRHDSHAAYSKHYLKG
jgi:hypothetical protein